jgi:hypothetical protein
VGPPDRSRTTAWNEDDDSGYLAWLAEHPGGFVLDTTVEPSARHLVLHRASCSRVSRPLSVRADDAPRFGKACALEPVRLRTWALEVTGGVPRECRLGGGEGGQGMA